MYYLLVGKPLISNLLCNVLSAVASTAAKTPSILKNKILPSVMQTFGKLDRDINKSF